MANDPVYIDPDVEMRVLAQADRRRQQVSSLRQQVTPQMVQQAQGLIQQHPNLSAGLLQALAFNQVPDEQAQALAEQDDGGGPLGSVWDFAGDVIDTATSAVDTALDRTYEYAIKPAIRGTVLAADALAQEVVQRPLTALGAAASGDAPSVRQAYNQYGDSPLVNAIQGDVEEFQRDAQGNPVLDESGNRVPNEQGLFGEGLFSIGGTAGAESEAERTLTINGRRADVGQAIANGLVGSFGGDPGDRAYDLVAGVGGFAVEVGLDPAAWLSGGATKVVKAQRALKAGDAVDVLSDLGAVSGARRNTVLVEKARNFFGNERLLQRLADSDEYTIMQSWSRSPANRLDIDMVRRLGDAKDQASVAEVLFDAVVHGDVTRKGFYSGTGNFIKRNLVESQSKFAGPFRYFTPEGKLAGLAPKGLVSADNIGEAAGKVDSLLRQANVPREARAAIFGRMARVESGRFDRLFDVVTDAVDEVARTVDADSSLNNIARNYREQIDGFRKYGVESWGDDIDVPYAKKKIIQNFDGEELEVMVPTPQITSELNSLALELPDAQAIRRAATDNRVMRAVYKSKGWDITEGAARTITNKVFKPLALLRPAYIVRIGAEEQARLAALGYDSLYTHPARFIAAMSRRKEFRDLMGEDLVDQARAMDVITKDAHGVLADATTSRGRIFKLAHRVEGQDLTDEFVRGWRGELGQLAAAPEARMMAQVRGNLDEFKTWAQSDDGAAAIKRIANINDESASLLDFGDDFDQWADGLRKRVEAKTAGWDEDLVQRVADKGVPYPGAGRKARNDEAAFANFLRGKGRNGAAPASVKVEHIPEGLKGARDSFVNMLFDNITGKPTSWLARYPAFRESMIRRTADLMDSLADDAMREEVFARAVKNLGADEAGVIRKPQQFKILRDALEKSKGRTGGPIESIDQLNDIVKARAADDVKDLLFDVTSRSAAQDTLAAVVPFLDAWKEVTVNWTRMTKENPAFFFRAQAGYRELQEQGSIYLNDHGDEVFRYPGGGALAAFVDRLNRSGGGPLGVIGAAGGAIADTVTGNTPDFATRLEGRTAGMNLVAQGVGPGFGPVVQWPAGLFKSPDLDKMREFIAPFGTDIEGLDDVLDIPEHLLPAWGKKFLNMFTEGGIDERQWNGMVGDAMKALAASGDYDNADAEKIEEDAQTYARWSLFARSFAQFAGPTGPQAVQGVDISERINPDHPDWNPEIDPDGHWFGVGTLASDYYRLLNTYGPEQANQKFYEMYGTEPFWIAQAKTRSLREMPVDAEGDRWMRRNEEFVSDYPVVAGFFAPTDEDAELDFSVYARQIANGDRQSLSPAEQAAEATKVRARAMWQAVKDRTENLPPDQREHVREQIRGKISDLHPGWDAPTPGLGQKLSTGQKIEQLQRAVADPRMADNPMTEPLAVYLQMREMALQQANAMGLKTLSSDKVAHLRQALYEAGTAFQKRYGAFAGVWSGVLSREVE